MRRFLSAAAAFLVAAACAGTPTAAAAGVPVVEDSWASGVTASAVDLNGSINPNGLSSSARIEYLPAASYEANLSASPPRDGFFGASSSPTGSGGVSLGSGSAAVPLSRHIGSLSAGSAYRYRLVASNSAGTTHGPAGWFATTESAPV